MKRFLLIAACSLIALPAAAETIGVTTGVNSTFRVGNLSPGLLYPVNADFVPNSSDRDDYQAQKRNPSEALKGEDFRQLYLTQRGHRSQGNFDFPGSVRVIKR